MTILNPFVTLLLVYSSFECTKSEEIVKIKYELSLSTPSNNYEISIHNDVVVASKENAFYITILSKVPILRPGMLNISHPTSFLGMLTCGLEQIEPGAFDNQIITEEIDLRGNKLRRIVTGTFKNLQIKKLNLWYNRIKHIEDNAFSNLPNLVEILLGENELLEFSGNSFLNTPKLSSFDMSFNKLKKLTAKSFSSMRKGERVNVAVSHNELEEIDPQAFDGLSVGNMILSNNKLREIPEEIFSKNGVMLLHLNNNRLKSLPQAFYQQKNLTDFDLTGNPLECATQKKLMKFGIEASVQIWFDHVNC